MSQQSAQTYLVESLGELERALAHLSYSEAACAGIVPGSSALTEDELIRVEAFTSRFARLIDLLSRRVLRALDHFELDESLKFNDARVLWAPFISSNRIVQLDSSEIPNPVDSRPIES